MSRRPLELELLPWRLAVCRLEADASPPGWSLEGPFRSVTRTPSELSIVCPEEAVPPGERAEPGWRCLAVSGTLAFGEIGILASLAAPLADAGISLFALSTFDTDYLLIQADALDRAISVLRAAGHAIET